MIRMGGLGHLCAHIGQENHLRIVRWMRSHCPPDTGLKIWALTIWVRTRHLSVTKLPTILNLFEWAGKKHCVSLKLGGQSGARSHDLRLPKQATSTTFHHCNIMTRDVKLTYLTSSAKPTMTPPGEYCPRQWIPMVRYRLVTRCDTI